MKITPTVGRVVWFYPANNQATSGFTPATEGEPLAAIIARVVDADAGAVHLAVFDGAGVSRSEPYVKLVQEGEKVPADGRYATWMPYQLGQAKKHANEVSRADEPKLPRIDTSDAAIEREIQAKGKTAPRVTPADIEANIRHEHYFTAKDGVIGDLFIGGVIDDPDGHGLPQSLDLLTCCVLTLQNGFTVTGESACASPENFDAEIGRKVARQNAVQKIWPLMGYALKQQLHLAAHEPPAPGAAHAGYSTMQPHQQRVVDERAELDEKLTKLNTFIDGTRFSALDADEQDRLKQQAATMAMYSDILSERIAAFAPA